MRPPRYNAARMTPVRLQHISKRFGSTIALQDITLDIRAGELFFLLGPSGCGKSTLLRLIAGLHQPNTGEIYFGDRDVTALGTEKRNAVMCFQSYALWPHMTVRDNIAFGLNVRQVEPAKRDQRILEMLRLVRLEELADRKPNQLSGGQQQRVALARAMAVDPVCLLLDEPLSNLDAKLRQEMRGEIRRICKTTGFTTIYVTHDQKEALSVADRIAVLDRGEIAQVGTPADLYYRPASSFVADFIGQTNLLRGELIDQNTDSVSVRTVAGIITAGKTGQFDAGQIFVSVRPEQIRVVSDQIAVRPGVNRLAGKIVETTFLGENTEQVLEVNGQRIKIIAPGLAPAPAPGGNAERIVEFDSRDALALAK